MAGRRLDLIRYFGLGETLVAEQVVKVGAAVPDAGLDVLSGQSAFVSDDWPQPDAE